MVGTSSSGCASVAPSNESFMYSAARTSKRLLSGERCARTVRTRPLRSPSVTTYAASPRVTTLASHPPPRSALALPSHSANAGSANDGDRQRRSYRSASRLGHVHAPCTSADVAVTSPSSRNPNRHAVETRLILQRLPPPGARVGALVLNELHNRARAPHVLSSDGHHDSPRT